MLTGNFLADFKRATEKKWSTASINPHLYGFQFQRGTRWNSGLSDKKITEYEGALQVVCPNDFREFLRNLNGTDLPTLNIYGNSGEPQRESVGVYSYPRDLELLRGLIENVRQARSQLTVTMAEQGSELPENANLVPIYGHRYLVCTPKLDESIVLSINDRDDAIVYGNSLEEYLTREFLSE
jgi:hypothetical protein